MNYTDDTPSEGVFGLLIRETELELTNNNIRFFSFRPSSPQDDRIFSERARAYHMKGEEGERTWGVRGGRLLSRDTPVIQDDKEFKKPPRKIRSPPKLSHCDNPKHSP